MRFIETKIFKKRLDYELRNIYTALREFTTLSDLSILRNDCSRETKLLSEKFSVGCSFEVLELIVQREGARDLLDDFLSLSSEQRKSELNRAIHDYIDTGGWFYSGEFCVGFYSCEELSDNTIKRRICSKYPKVLEQYRISFSS